jgi:hypothetical protein
MLDTTILPPSDEFNVMRSDDNQNNIDINNRALDVTSLWSFIVTTTTLPAEECD